MGRAIAVRTGRMAWRQGAQGPEQHLLDAAAAARARTQRPGKHLAVYAPELAVEPSVQIVRRYCGPLLLCLEQRSSISPGRSCLSPAAIGQPWVIHVR